MNGVGNISINNEDFSGSMNNLYHGQHSPQRIESMNGELPLLRNPCAKEYVNFPSSHYINPNNDIYTSNYCSYKNSFINPQQQQQQHQSTLIKNKIHRAEKISNLERRYSENFYRDNRISLSVDNASNNDIIYNQNLEFPCHKCNDNSHLPSSSSSFMINDRKILPENYHQQNSQISLFNYNDFRCIPIHDHSLNYIRSKSPNGRSVNIEQVPGQVSFELIVNKAPQITLSESSSSSLTTLSSSSSMSLFETKNSSYSVDNNFRHKSIKGNIRT